MGYYQAGDYYQGDYYQGDFLGLGKFAKKVVSIGSGIVSKLGIPVVSGIAGVVSQATQARPSNALVPNISNPGLMVIPEPGITGIVHRAAEGGHPGIGRLKKDGSFTDRRRPRMNVGNMKALRRANRRAHGFLRAYKSAVSYFVAKAPKGKAYVHFKKKSR